MDYWVKWYSGYEGGAEQGLLQFVMGDTNVHGCSLGAN